MNAGECYRLVMASATDTNQDRAVALLQEALRHDPQSKLACYHLGLIFAGRGLHRAAIQWYKRIVTEIDQDDPGVWFLLARQYHLADDLEEARASYVHTFELDPMCEKAFLYISEILVRQGKDPATALKYAERALELRPSSCMVELEAFEDQLECARQCESELTRCDATSPEPPSPQEEPEIRRATLRRLLNLSADVGPILDRHGIRCAGCAGYEDETLERAASDAGSDLGCLIREISMSLARARA
jgi:tetratricopeptide (TPR) repeat protein